MTDTPTEPDAPASKGNLSASGEAQGDGAVLYRRLVLSLAGALQGAVLFGLSESWTRSWDKADVITLYLIAAIAPGLFILLYQRTSWRRDLLFALGVGVAVGLLYKAAFVLAGVVQLNIFWATATLSFVLPIAFYQAARDARRLAFPYDRLYLHAWTNKLVPFVGSFLVACAWAVLFLWWKLFGLIGITFFRELFTEKAFIFIFTCTVFALGVAIARERPAIIQSLLKIVLTLFGILAPLLGGIAILFIAAVPVAGLDTLWKTSYATYVLLVVPFAFILFVNAVIQTGAADNRFRPPLDKLILLANLIMPVFVGLVVWAIYLRVGQYGWTPRRLEAAYASAIALAYTLTYAYAVVRRRGGWMQAVVKANPYLAAGTLVVALLVHLPPLEPTAISARDQVARLRSGATPPEKFDFAFLKLRLGDAGKAAFAELDADQDLKSNPVIAAGLDNARTKLYYSRSRSWARQSTPPGLSDAELADVGSYMKVVPAGEALPEDLIKKWVTERRHFFSPCKTEKSTAKNGQCVFMVMDLNGDGLKDAALFPHFSVIHTKIKQLGGGWETGPMFMSGLRNDKLKQLREAAGRGEVSLVPREIPDIMIGGTRFK
jgi:hypothetical protein